MAIFSTESSASAYASLPLEVNTLKLKVDLSLIPASNALLTAFKNLLTDINNSTPEKLEGSFAADCGFKHNNNQVVFDQSLIKYDKVTYYACFRLPFTEGGNPDKFETWRSLANKVRLEAWKAGIAGIKRLGLNGENEIYTSSTLPTDENTPPIVSEEYKTKQKYTLFEETVHRLLEPDFFNASGVTDIPLYVYLLSAPETPYRTQWLERMKSIPFFPQGVPPKPVAGTFTKVTVTPEKTPIIVNDGLHFNRTTKVTEVQSDGSLKLEGYKETKVYVSIYDWTSGSAQLKVQAGTKDITDALDDGTYYISGNKKLRIHVENDPSTPYLPDLKNKSFFRTKKVYAEQNRNYVTIFEKGFSTKATVTPPAGITKQDLVGWPISSETANNVTTYYVAYPKHPEAGKQTEGAALEGRAKTSGLTLGVGIDAGNSLDNNPNGRAFLNNYLTATVPSWSQLSAANKDKVYEILGKKGKAGSDVWVRNRPLFDSLDQENATRNYADVLVASMPFINDSYLNPAVNAFKAQSGGFKLRVELNVVEKYVIATLSWNNPSSVRSRSARFANAINQHNHTLLLDIVKEMISSGKNNNAPHVKEVLESDRMKNYYKNNHHLV